MKMAEHERGLGEFENLSKELHPEGLIIIPTGQICAVVASVLLIKERARVGLFSNGEIFDYKACMHMFGCCQVFVGSW